MTAASVRDDITPLAGHGLLYANTRQVQCRCYQWFTKASFNGHLADVAWMHVEPLLADLRADNDKLRDEHQAWRSAVAWQKRGLAAEAKVERVEALADEWAAHLSGSGGVMIYDETARQCWAMAERELRAALRDDDAATPRCQHVSPSPWGPTQCALEDGHAERHAYNPSEVPALRGDDAATHTEDPRVSIRTIEHDGGGLEITAADDYYLDEEYVTVDGRHVLRLWVRPSDEETPT